MKLNTLLVALLANSVFGSKIGDILSKLASDKGPIEASGSSNSESIEGYQNDADYSRTVVLKGGLSFENMCMPDNEPFCGTSKKGLAFACAAYQAALSNITGAYVVSADLSANVDNADVDDIEFKVSGMAHSYAFTSGVSNVRTGAYAATYDESGAYSGAASAFANSYNSANSQTSAYASASGSAESSAYTASTFTVKGKSLTKFKGLISISVSAVAQTDSEARSSSISRIAIDAYTAAAAYTCYKYYKRSVCDSDYATDSTQIKLLADLFGRAVASALVDTTVAYTFEAFLEDKGNKIEAGITTYDDTEPVEGYEPIYSCKARLRN